MLDGGPGVDTLIGSAGNELFVGQTGNDTITTGTGYDIIAFNRGDGQETEVASTGADNTVTLGGGITFQDLALSMSGNDLILSSGCGEQITLLVWYSGTTLRCLSTLLLGLD